MNKTHILPKIKQGIFFVTIAVIIFSPGFSDAQGIPSGGGASESRIEGDFKFMPIPYVNYSRSVGFTVGALPMAMFNPIEDDSLSPSSMAGMLGMYTTNKTWFVMGFSKIYLDADNWRIAFAGGTGSLNFQFYLDNPINSWIPYNTAMNFIVTQVQRRIVDKIYFGLSYIYTEMNTSSDVFPTEENIILRGLGAQLAMDRRLNVYYPTDGYITNLKYTTYPSWMGNSNVSNKIEIDYNQYFSFRENQDVLVGRAFIGLGLDDLSFNQ